MGQYRNQREHFAIFLRPWNLSRQEFLLEPLHGFPIYTLLVPSTARLNPKSLEAEYHFVQTWLL